MIDHLLRVRSLVIALFVLLLAFAAYGTTFLTIDPNNRVFFSERHEHFSALVKLEDRFGSNTNLLFLIVSDETIFDDGHLPGAIRWLASEVWRIEQVVAVDSIASYPHVSGSPNELIVDELLSYVCPSEGGCRVDRSASLFKPYLVNRLLGPEAKSFAIVADVDLSNPTSSEVTEIARAAERLKEEFNKKFPSLSVFLTGGVPMMQAFYDAAKKDSESLMAVALLVLAIGLFVFLGGAVPALLMILLGVSSIAVTLGVAGWSGYVVNTATATVPLIVLTLVIASAMHVFLHIVREDGMGSNEGVVKAVKTSIAANWRPVLLTAITTAVGLLSMVFVSAPPLRELGVLCAFGVVVGAAFSLTIVPCLFSYLPRLRVSDWLAGLQAVMNRYARWLEAVRPSMLGVGIVFVFALVGLTNISVDEDFVRYFAPGTEFREDAESITERLASPYHVDVIHDSGSAAGIYQTGSIRELEALTAFLRDRPEVSNVLSLVDVLKEVSLTLGGSSELKSRSVEELAQYFLSYELSLNAGQSAGDLVDADYRRSRISVLLEDVSMAELRGLVEAVQAWAAERGISEKVVVSGEGVPSAYLSSESIQEMAVGIAASILLSAALVGLYFRSVGTCLSVFFATLVPILSGFGAWGWIEPEIGMAATLVVAITIGVVIDDTIHLTYRYIDSYRNLDLTPWGATAYSIHKTGTAIVVTSVVLVAGLLVLIGSQFRMNSTFGVCASLVIVLALLYNLTIAPHFLRRFS